VFDTHIMLNTEGIFVLLFQRMHYGRNVAGSFVKHIPCQLCHVQHHKCKSTSILSNTFSAEQKGVQKYYVLMQDKWDNTGF